MENIISLIVSAPRAQSSFVLQRAINETGVIFRCKLSVNQLSNECEPLTIETHGNIFDERWAVDGLLKGEKRDNQWLGASMDGGAGDGATLVVDRLCWSSGTKMYFMLCFVFRFVLLD